MYTLDLELLRTLIAVYEQGSYEGAADKVFRTQAAVSQQMRKLESVVGVPLFEKEGRSKRLSSQGMILLEYARHLLAINDEAVRALKEGGLEGSLRIGASADIADTLLPLLLSSIAHWSPRLRITVQVHRSPVLMDSIKKGDADMVLSSRQDPSLEGFIIRSSPTVWICSAEYAHNPNQPVRLILADEPSIYRQIALRALRDAGIAWEQSYEATSLFGVKAAVAANLGVTARSIETYGPGMRIIGPQEGLPGLPPVDYHLLIRNDVINPTIRQVFQMIRETYALQIVSSKSGEKTGSTHDTA